MKKQFVIAWLAGCCLVVASAQEKDLKARVGEAFRAKDFSKVIELTKGKTDNPLWKEARGAAFQERGVDHFFHARIAESIADFDEYLKLYPERDPHHWQRGLSYYYAEEYEKGVAQFERHQTVNSHDVENAVWHFLCVVRAPDGGFKQAQKALIPIEGDSRVPMKEVHELFAGRGTVEDVLKAAEPSDPDNLGDRERNHLCYAHLYLALYFEAAGQPEKMKKHIQLAAGKYKMDHYMGKVAQVHAKLRLEEKEIQ